MGVGEVVQEFGVAVQPLAERARDVGCPLIECDGAVLEASGVLIGSGDVRAGGDGLVEAGGRVGEFCERLAEPTRTLSRPCPTPSGVMTVVEGILWGLGAGFLHQWHSSGSPRGGGCSTPHKRNIDTDTSTGKKQGTDYRKIHRSETGA
ncbi:hypothetical protein ACFV2H_13625 [Streptomyces sp. NPDC059629]|uniref:hypothetical protein n=1 Tax=Streptomyces sp. NPDC059629 TaxID=3346889 RepID=UPI0036CBB508